MVVANSRKGARYRGGIAGIDSRVTAARQVLAFADESGDPGLRLSAGSSKLFVVGLVLFDDPQEAQATDKTISNLRSNLGLSQRFEFKFSACSPSFREQFLRVVSKHNFHYCGIVIDKAKLTGQGFRYKESFYKYTSKLVFLNAKPFLNEALVIIDGSGSKDFRQQLGNYLKRQINDSDLHCIREVRVQDSRRNNLLQLADMVVGALHRSFSPKSDADLYRSIVRRKELMVQRWPRYKRSAP